MYDAFGRLQERDRVAMALASYTAGLGHVLDACSLAAADGGDPTLWSGNVEESLALLSNPDYALRATHGGACGHQAVAFVNLVLDRWEDYAAAATLKREMVEDSTVGTRQFR
jgi:membrane-bound lytic murein transglycosylase F